MRYLLTLIYIVFCIPAFAQEEDEYEEEPNPVGDFSKSVRGIGISANGDSLFGTHIDVSPFQIVNYKITGGDSLIYLYLKKPVKGGYESDEHIVCYNLRLHKKVWTRTFPFKISFSTSIINSVIVINERDETVAYDAYSGERLRGRMDKVIFASEKHQLFLTEEGHALDATTLKTLWRVKWHRDYGLFLKYKPGSDMLLVEAKGLMGINLKTGEYWYHSVSTGVANTGANIAAAAAATAESMISGMPALYPSPEKTHGMQSGITLMGDDYVYAGRNEIFCVSERGIELWRKKLPDEMTGKSYIWTDKEHVYLLNSGIAFMYFRPVAVARPYIARYNKLSGDMEYSKPIDVGEYTKALAVSENEVAILNGNVFSIINTVNGMVTKSANIVGLEGDVEINSKAVVYTRKGEAFGNLQSGWLLIDGKRKTIRLNKDLEVVDSQGHDYYLKVAGGGDYELLFGAKNVVFLKDNKIVAEVRKYADPRSVQGKNCLAVLKRGLLLYTLPE